jgi:hypothetical protein
MVLGLGVHVLGLHLIVLQRGQRPDRVLARREEHDHRFLAVALQARAQLIPARQALVVGLGEPHLGRAEHALRRDRRAAVFLICGRVDHAVVVVLMAALADA